MKFVSNYGAYKIAAVKGKIDRLSGIETEFSFICEFRPDVTTSMMDMLYELESQGRLKFNGLARDASTGLPKDPAERCSSYDTTWISPDSDDDLRVRVEQGLMSNPDLGKCYWLYEEARKPAPWPAYDELKVVGKRTVEMVAEKIVQVSRDMGIDPAEVIAYESENLRREVVLEALERAQETNDALKEVEEEEVVVA